MAVEGSGVKVMFVAKPNFAGGGTMLEVRENGVAVKVA